MFKKDYRDLSVVKHVLTWLIATPVLFMLVSTLPASFAEDTYPGATATTALWSIMAGVFLGPIIGLFMWLANRGAHAIAALLRSMRDEARQAQYAARVEAAEDMQEALAYQDAVVQEQDAPAYIGGYNDDTIQITPDMTQPIPQVGNDPWQGTNPYGCCQNNYDEDGVLHHGSSDCRHPQIVGEN